MHFKKGVSGCKAVIVERFCSKQELVSMSCKLASDHIISHKGVRIMLTEQQL